MADESYEITKSETICVACDCIKGVHLSFWKCPIFDNEKICAECCHIGTLQHDVDKVFSEKLGRSISKEEINKTCKDCGKNYALQNPLLSPEVLNKRPDDRK